MNSAFMRETYFSADITSFSVIDGLIGTTPDKVSDIIVGTVSREH
ncbi:hypothetical protein Mpsy_3030 [Methanolobus psychrophilus R15]|nr:hypothetical protein Mpsy_3030 [Methanolobus psychrophilus R15]